MPTRDIPRGMPTYAIQEEKYSVHIVWSCSFAVTEEHTRLTIRIYNLCMYVWHRCLGGHILQTS